jgi:hypothetical protein
MPASPKDRAPASTHKKVVVLLLDRTPVQGYLNSGDLGRSETIDLLSPDGEHRSISLSAVKCVYFVREFQAPFQPERKVFLSRPKIDGLWVRLRFRDEDLIEGLIGNNLRIYVPRSALEEIKVLGVVGAARRTPARPRVPASQSKLFSE